MFVFIAGRHQRLSVIYVFLWINTWFKKYMYIVCIMKKNCWEIKKGKNLAIYWQMKPGDRIKNFLLLHYLFHFYFYALSFNNAPVSFLKMFCKLKRKFSTTVERARERGGAKSLSEGLRMKIINLTQLDTEQTNVLTTASLLWNCICMFVTLQL